MTKSETQFLNAASKGHVRVLEKMLDACVNVNVLDTRGTPWNRTALMHAAENGHSKIVNLLLKAGANVNAIDKGIPSDVPGGNTALILAIRNGHVEVAHRLLDAGASPRTRGGGKSVITAAAFMGNKRLFDRLIALGADVGQRDGSGFTPIASAVQDGKLGVVELLLSSDVDPNSRTPGGAPVLVDSALGGHPNHLRICKALVQAGADPNCGDEDNFTPLMAGCRGAQVEIVRFLLSLPIRVNEVDREHGRTALDIIHGLQKPPNFAPEVLRRLKKMAESMGPPRSRLKEIERLLRRAGAKTAAELGHGPRE
jgi:ankyrin repeat protein